MIKRQGQVKPVTTTISLSVSLVPHIASSHLSFLHSSHDDAPFNFFLEKKTTLKRFFTNYYTSKGCSFFILCVQGMRMRKEGSLFQKKLG